jgi:Zn-dependent protease
MASDGRGDLRSHTPRWRVGTIGCVPVYIDRSWLIFVPLMVLAGGLQLVSSDPELGVPGACVASVAFAGGLAVSVLVHDLAQAFLAARSGCRLPPIVVSLAGRHAVPEAGIGRPMTLALVALVGLAANAILALVAVLALRAVPPGGVAHLLMMGILVASLLSAVLNGMPALPADGGRLIESIVWGITGRRHRAFVAVGWWGRVVAVFLLIWALLPMWVVGPPPVNPSSFGFLFFLVVMTRALQLWGVGTQAIRSSALV